MMGNVFYICHTKWSLLRTIRPESALFANSKGCSSWRLIMSIYSWWPQDIPENVNLIRKRLN